MLGALKRTAESNLRLKRIQRIICSLYAISSFECYIWGVVRYPRRVRSHLSFERYVWHGDYYPGKVRLQLPFERYLWRVIQYPRRLPTQLPFVRYL